MCDSREKIIEDHYILQQAEKRLTKRGLNGEKPTEEETLENAKDIELLLYMSKESLIFSKQAWQNSEKAREEIERYPSVTRLLAKMPMVIIPLFFALLIIVLRLSDPMEIVNLLSFVKLEVTPDAIKQSSLTIVLILGAVSGMAFFNQKSKQEKKS